MSQSHDLDASQEELDGVHEPEGDPTLVAPLEEHEEWDEADKTSTDLRADLGVTPEEFEARMNEPPDGDGESLSRRPPKMRPPSGITVTPVRLEDATPPTSSLNMDADLGRVAPAESLEEPDIDAEEHAGMAMLPPPVPGAPPMPPPVPGSTPPPLAAGSMPPVPPSAPPPGGPPPVPGAGGPPPVPTSHAHSSAPPRRVPPPPPPPATTPGVVPASPLPRASRRSGAAAAATRRARAMAQGEPPSLGPLPPLPQVGNPHGAGPFAPLPDSDANRWRAAIERLQREANALGEVTEAARIHLEIGRLHEEKLGQPRQAASAYQAAFNLDPRDPAILHASRRLFAEVGNWAMVVQILGHQISGASSVHEQATLLAEKGAIQEHELRHVEGAREAYEEALGLWPAEPQALAALERLHLFHKSHEPLFEVYARALDADLGPDRRLPLLLAAAQLAEDRLEDLDGAVGLNEEALRLDAAHPVALASLRRLQQQRGDKRALLAALERSADVSGDEASVQHLAAAARLALDGLEDPDLAVSLLERGRRRSPSHPGILRELAFLHQRAGRDDALIEILRAAVPAANGRERATLLHRLGRALERNGDPSAAAAAEQDALRAEKSYAPAAQALGRLLERLDRPDALVELYNLEIDAETDPEERVSRWFKLAVLLETRLNNVDGAVDALRALLEVEPEYPPARKRLEQLLVKKEAWGELVALHEEEVELTADNELKVFLLGRIGSLAEEKLDDPVRAKSAMQRLLELSPKHLGAIRSLSRVAEREQDHGGLLRLLEIEAEATDDQAEVLALMQRRADLLARELGDREAAIVVLEQLLSLNPTYLPALRTLGRLHAEGGDWVELVRMHRRELDVTKSARHRVDLLFRLAQLLEERLGDQEGAIEAYEGLLEVEPDNVAAARALAELYARRGDVEKLAELRLGEAENIEAPAERCAALVEVAELYEERLDRSDKAADLYQRVLREGHDVDAATRALVRIYSREGMWNALVGALRTAADRAADPRTRSAVLLRSAQIHADKLKNLDASVELLEQAANLLPEDRAVLEQLERSSVARRDWPRALEVGERLAHLETDANARAARHLRLAAILEKQLEPPQSGAEQYRAALEAVPDHPVALRALEGAYLASRNWAGLAAVHVREAAAATQSGHRASLLVRAAEIHEERLDDHVEATRFYDLSLESDPTHLSALRGRRRLAERDGDTMRALELLAREGELLADDREASELVFEAGRMRQDELGDVDGAIAAYEEVLEQEPGHLGAFNRLEMIFLDRDDAPRVRALLTGRARAVDDAPERARLLVSAGRVAEERLRDRNAAINDYRAALEHEPRSADALIRLGPLLMNEQRWSEAVEVFHQTLAVSRESTILRDTFKSLGVIYQEHQQDLVKSVQSFQAALRADPRDTESLYRLAELYRGVEDWSSAINVTLRLAEVEQEGEGKTKALQDLAELYLTGPGDSALAIAALRKAVEIEPGCRPALLRLCELHEQREEWSELTEAAGVYVASLRPEERKEAAPLHLRMADVFEKRLGDDPRAINALRHALDASPGDPEALTALARLYGKRVETYPEAIEAHRQLLSEDAFRVESYHELHRMFERRGEHDRAFVAAEILVFLRAQTQEEYVYFHENKMYVADVADGVLTPEEHARWVQHPEEKGALRAVFEVFGAELGRAYPGDLLRHNLKRENKLGPRSQSNLRVLTEELGTMLGVPLYDLWLGADEDVGVHIENEKPPAVVVGGRFAKRLPLKHQRFVLASALERLKGGHLLFDAPQRELESLVASVILMGSANPGMPVDPAGIDNAQRKLQKHLSSRGRRQLEEISRVLVGRRVDIERHRAVGRFTSHRAGLLASNDIETAMRVVARGRAATTVFASHEEAAKVLGGIPEVTDLLSWAVSDAYFEAREKLGFSVQPA